MIYAAAVVPGTFRGIPDSQNGTHVPSTFTRFSTKLLLFFFILQRMMGKIAVSSTFCPKCPELCRQRATPLQPPRKDLETYKVIINSSYAHGPRPTAYQVPRYLYRYHRCILLLLLYVPVTCSSYQLLLFSHINSCPKSRVRGHTKKGTTTAVRNTHHHQYNHRTCTIVYTCMQMMQRYTLRAYPN